MNSSYAMILGVRGSVPVSTPEYSAYGGATTCIFLSLEGQPLILDAGTGILALPEEALKQPSLPLLLTHAHLDHLNGLAMCPYVMRQGKILDIYASLIDGSDIQTVLERIYAPPVWPVRPDQFAAALNYHPMQQEFRIGAVHVKTMDGVHPNGVKLLRLEGGGVSVVFATDCTLTESFFPHAVSFAGGCDLLLCDGQYSEEEWPTRSEYGHNMWKTAADLGKRCGAAKTLIIHHDPTHTDDVLDAAADALRAQYPTCGFAREGEVVLL